jgi:hypothetical protein
MLAHEVPIRFSAFGKNENYRPVVVGHVSAAIRRVRTEVCLVRPVERGDGRISALPGIITLVVEQSHVKLLFARNFSMISKFLSV